MSIPKYSKLEHERRWLVPSAYIESLKDKPYIAIEDRYLDCGRLRLRSMTSSLNGEKVFKLCKKYGAISNCSEPITNIYLTENEFNAFLSIEGKPLFKKRFKQESGGYRFNFDVFAGNLNGLILCEIEAQDEDSLKSIQAPSCVISEVTDMHIFSGGSLCLLSNFELHKILSARLPPE